MPFSNIDALPTAPQRTDDADTFIERADAFVAALITFRNQLNTFKAELEAAAALIAAAPAYADTALKTIADSSLTPAADRGVYYTSSSVAALFTLTTQARQLLDDTSFDAMLTTLGLTANGKSLVTAADYAAMRTLLGLVVGTNVQAYDAELAALAGLTSAADKGIQFTGSGTAGLFDLTAFAKTLLDDANAAAALTTLGAQAALTFTSNGNGIALGVTIGGTTYYIQAGTKTQAANSDGTITYPVAFTTAAYCACIGGPSGSGDAGTLHTRGTSGLTTQDVSNTSGGASITGNWIAIGY